MAIIVHQKHEQLSFYPIQKQTNTRRTTKSRTTDKSRKTIAWNKYIEVTKFLAVNIELDQSVYTSQCRRRKLQ